MTAGRCLRALAAATLAAAAALACASAPPPYRHNRYDYRAFAARMGGLPEPNYLPFVAHVERLPGGGRGLVFCRWPDEAFPLRVAILVDPVPPELEPDRPPREAMEYERAVARALERWERAIGRPVRFARVERPEEADLRIRVRARAEPERAPREGLVLGFVERMDRACRVLGPGPTADEVRVRFRVPEAVVAVSDRHGLLAPGQVERVALHEIAHALGAAGHSPLRGDALFPNPYDALPEKLSEQDMNTFRALYAIPPGSVYVRFGEAHREPGPAARRGPPRLDPPFEDARLGARLRLPSGWQRIRTKLGWVAVDGVSWDYDASIQIFRLRASPEELARLYVERFALRGELVATERLGIDGRPVVRIVRRNGPAREETSILPWPGGVALVVVADCRDADYEHYRAWFGRVLLALEPLEPAAPPAGRTEPERAP